MAAHSPETTRESPRTTPTTDGRAPATTTTGGRSGGALASMIVGIVAIPAVIIPILGIVLGILAITLGAIARSSGASNRGQAMAGIICGGVALVVAVGIIVLAASSAS